MNRRQQKTRNSIFNAFIELLSTKSYNKITVQDIIYKADIGRSTFYSHFETKDDLIREYCTELFEHIFSKNMEMECYKKFSKNDDLESLITHILYHLQEGEKNIRKILVCESSEIFIMYFKEYIFKLFDKYIIPKINKNNPHLPEDFLKNHIVSSLIETIKWWMVNNMKEKPEFIAKYYLAVIIPIL